MQVLFLDEIGSYDSGHILARTTDEHYNPVFGYGGLVIPAANLAKFATQFFDIKTISVYNEIVNRPPQSRRDRNDRMHLERLSHKEIQEDAVVRRLAAKLEIKGRQVFSKGYAVDLFQQKQNSVPGASGAYKRFFDYAKWFLKTLKQHEGRVIFYGVEKISLREKELPDPHVAFVANILDQAFRIADSRNTTISLFWDHHQNDIRTKDGWFRNGPRAARAREIIIARQMVDRITEPVVSLNSAESQCIQAADWICSLLSQTLPFYCSEAKGINFQLFHDELDEFLLGDVSEVSEFRTLNGKFYGNSLQRELHIEMPLMERALRKRRRPYHD